MAESCGAPIESVVAGAPHRRPEALELGTDGSPRLRPRAGADGMVHLSVSADSDHFSPQHFKGGILSPKFEGSEVVIDPADPWAGVPEALRPKTDETLPTTGGRPAPLTELGSDGSPRLRPRPGEDGYVHMPVSPDSDHFSPQHFKGGILSPKFDGREVVVDPKDPLAAVPEALRHDLVLPPAAVRSTAESA